MGMNLLPRSLLLLALSFSGAFTAHAQLNIPLSTVTRAYPTLDRVTLTLSGTSKVARPTPLVINSGALALTAGWFCLDPLQTILFSPTNEPAGNSLVFASTNPAHFDKWSAAAPGLTTSRIQTLADLFQAYAPSGAAASALLAGALQLAIWEIANEPVGNVFSLTGAGSLSVAAYQGSSDAATMINLANTMLSSLATTGIKNVGNVAGLDFLIDGTYRRNGTTTTVLVQDLVGFAPVLPIPEPSTYALGAVGLLFAVIAHRRLRRAPLSPQAALR